MPATLSAPAPQPLLQQRYQAIRTRSVHLCAPLAIEDYVPQPIIDVSPPKWHLGHTSWFFEALVLQAHQADYRVFHPKFGFVFNSYYETQGKRVQRVRRGDLSRPTVAEVMAYRTYVDQAMLALLDTPLTDALTALIELGLQHEQQHQELLLTDLKYIFSVNPLAPVYDPARCSGLVIDDEHAPEHAASGLHSADLWLDLPEQILAVGHDGQGFGYDNEMPRHAVLVPSCSLRKTLVTNREYVAFMLDGGYQRFEHWHSEGWDWVKTLTQPAPLYWQRDPERPDDPQAWLHFTLDGLQPLPMDAPVSHLCWYEAAAWCDWAGLRLPTEFEWEAAAPMLAWGRRWEWTQSAYQPYPGFQRAAGAVGEYNGKFMVNQQVLRGASYATPPGHARQTYRNFFHPPLRWQYTGLRPARSHDGG